MHDRVPCVGPSDRVVLVMTTEPVPAVAVVVHHGQLGVVALEALRAGATVLVIDGPVVATPDRHTLQIGIDEHVAAQALPSSPVGFPAWRFLDHACTPNTHLVGRALIASVDIAAGAAVNFDYETTESDMAAPFLCRCGAPACRGLIRGHRHLTLEQRSQLVNVAAHLRGIGAGTGRPRR
jgi:hypothetical protein